MKCATAFTALVTHQIVAVCVQLGIRALIKALGTAWCPEPEVLKHLELHIRRQAPARLTPQRTVAHGAVRVYLGRELKTEFLCAHKWTRGIWGKSSSVFMFKQPASLLFWSCQVVETWKNWFGKVRTPVDPPRSLTYHPVFQTCLELTLGTLFPSV